MRERCDESTWIFGYGSLIWRPDFEFLETRPAWLSGWARHFWQGSHDHRGTPASPGRVVTIVPDPGERCGGMAYRVAGTTESGIFAALDHREKNGYERFEVTLELPGRCSVPAMVYTARPDNPAWLGEAPLETMAAQIVAAAGPSGPNLEYLLRLDTALTELGIEDDAVTRLSQRVRSSLHGDRASGDS